MQSFKAIHLQELQFKEVGNPIVKDNFTIIKEFTSPYDLDLMAKNEGLSREALNNYFKNCDLNKPFAIIHTNNFKYK